MILPNSFPTILLEYLSCLSWYHHIESLRSQKSIHPIFSSTALFFVWYCWHESEIWLTSRAYTWPLVGAAAIRPSSRTCIHFLMETRPWWGMAEDVEVLMTCWFHLIRAPLSFPPNSGPELLAPTEAHEQLFVQLRHLCRQVAATSKRRR